LSKLTYPTTFVVDRDNVKSGAEWWRKPNGTGPFILRSWEDENQLVLEKYEDFYGDVSGIDFVIFSLWGGVPMYMYENGEIDVTSIYINYIDKVTDRTGDFYDELSIFPELSFYYIGFNNNSPPFDDINIRRAFSRAVDKEKLALLVFRDMIEVADGILPPGMPGFNDEISGLDFNVEAAKQLIKESSYGDVSQLPPITITTQGWGGDISQDLEAVINEWRINLGVEVTVRQLEPSRFLYHLKEEKDEMYYLGWIADYPHPQNFLDILFYTGAENNYGEYSNTELDTLLDKAGKELDSNLSLEMYRHAEQILVDEAACISLYFGQNYVLIKPYVNGYYLNPLGITMYNQVSIDSSR
jgi:oligopeptide transport system substrate-binding protein